MRVNYNPNPSLCQSTLALHLVGFSPMFGERRAPHRRVAESWSPMAIRWSRTSDDVHRRINHTIPLLPDMPGADLGLGTRTYSRGVYAVLLGGTLLWCGAIFAAPLLSGGPWSGVSSFLYQFFHPICNQLDSHSFHIAGEKTAVCIRCTSIYVSFLAGLLVYPALSAPTRRIEAGRHSLLVAAAPMVVDVALSVLKIHESTSLSRLLTGSFFGIIAVFIVVPILMDAMSELKNRPRVLPSPTIIKD